MALAKIVYASMTGHTEEIADIVAEGFEYYDFDVEVMECSSVDPSDFADADICVIATYTYNVGGLPSEFVEFYKDLADEDLSGKIYGVVGSGDTYFEEFCLAVDKFSAQFEKTGAQKGAEPVKIDFAVEEEDIPRLQDFVKSLVEHAGKKIS